MIRVTTLALCTLMCLPLQARGQVEGQNQDPTQTTAQSTGQTTAQTIDQKLWSMALDVLAVSGLAPNFKVRADTDIHNAAAYIENNERILAYNPRWIARFTGPEASENDRWALVSTVAHELAHHLQGHTILPGGSRPATELEADDYAGFALAGLGATLAQAQYTFLTDDLRGSATHPGRAARLAATANGWNRYHARKTGVAVIPNRTPAVTAPAKQDPVTAAPPSQPLPKPAPTPQTTPPQNTGDDCTPISDATIGPAATLCTTSQTTDGPIGQLGQTGIRDPWIAQGLTATLTYTFDAPVTLTQLRLINGHNGSEKDWRRYARTEALTLTGSNGHSRQIIARDHRDWQDWTLIGFQGVTWLQITVDRTIQGRRYDSVALSAMRLN